MNRDTNELRFLEDVPPEYKDIIGADISPWVPVPAKHQRKAHKLLKDAPRGTAVYGNPDWIKPQRNAPCTCGSGIKYKKCCGKVSQ